MTNALVLNQLSVAFNSMTSFNYWKVTTGSSSMAMRPRLVLGMYSYQILWSWCIYSFSAKTHEEMVAFRFWTNSLILSGDRINFWIKLISIESFNFQLYSGRLMKSVNPRTLNSIIASVVIAVNSDRKTCPVSVYDISGLVFNTFAFVRLFLIRPEQLEN